MKWSGLTLRISTQVKLPRSTSPVQTTTASTLSRRRFPRVWSSARPQTSACKTSLIWWLKRLSRVNQLLCRKPATMLMANSRSQCTQRISLMQWSLRAKQALPSTEATMWATMSTKADLWHPTTTLSSTRHSLPTPGLSTRRQAWTLST